MSRGSSLTRLATLVLAGCALALAAPGAAQVPAPPRPRATARANFDVVETTIAQVHRAMRARRLTAHQLVQAYLDRIAAYDHAGPNLNALIVVNPRALAVADSLDANYARTGRFAGPLHGIPVIVKDNYDTFDLPTTVGSRSLHGAIPPRDATMVAKIRAAGAIVLAKSNMAEFAFSPYETVGSELPGYTFNPYALNRVPAGSSGGTAAAVAASLGEIGLGTDTGNSIRGPSSHEALVGIRPTIGLTSRAGIAPLFLERDVGGPMARTVADAAALLDVLAGANDRRDTATARAAGHIPPSYTAFLKADALKGARIGVARNISNRPGADSEVLERFQQALGDLRKAGATVVDSVNMSFMDSIQVGVCNGFRHDIEAYLAARPEAPVHTLPEILASKKYHPSIQPRLEAAMQDTTSGQPARCAEVSASRARFKEALHQVLAQNRLDAIAYPTWSDPPRLIGDLATPAGDNSQTPAPAAGFPAITVPMGYTRGTLPAGLQLLGDAWSEPRLIALAFAYEQATKHRHAPALFPALGR